jgi:hypothetical protein
MNTYAQIKNGKVVNMIKWDGNSELNLDGELIPANPDAYIGGAYTSNAFVPSISQEELDQSEQEAIEIAESKEALRQSMITKLAATLTPEETALLEELL